MEDTIIIIVIAAILVLAVWKGRGHFKGEGVCLSGYEY